MKSKTKTSKQNVRCNFCGCAFVPNPKTQREGEILLMVLKSPNSTAKPLMPQRNLLRTLIPSL